MIKTKVVEFEGEKFSIARLKVGQVQDFSTKDEDATPAATNARGAALIAHSLNNAEEVNRNGHEPAAPWTPERVLNEFDFMTFNFLSNEVMEFMGWRPAAVPAEKKSDDTAAR